MKTPILSKRQIIAKAGAGDADLVEDAILAQVTVAHANDLHLQCLCWLISFKPGATYEMNQKCCTATEAYGTTVWEFSLIYADTGNLVFGSGRGQRRYSG